MDYDMNALQEKVSGELRVGASTTISQYVLPGIIADFHNGIPTFASPCSAVTAERWRKPFGKDT
jgi:DNA-binding transcriptional LysR family regulator